MDDHDTHTAPAPQSLGCHTPGPWVARRMHTGGFDIFDPRNRDVVTVYGGGVEIESREANARLIAAAPELLDGLTEARTTLSILRTQIMVEIGRCADPSESRWDGVPEKLKERIEEIDAAIARATGATQ